MTVRILVTDRWNRPVENARVVVNWQQSYSVKNTGSDGIADLGCAAGTAIRVSIDGKAVTNSDYYLKNGISRFLHPSK